MFRIWTFATPAPAERTDGTCPTWVTEDNAASRATLEDLATILEGSPLDADGDLARAIRSCSCPEGRIEMTVGNLAARHRVCQYADWVARENSRLWEAWAENEREAQEELGP